jgi:hypothetical protein
MARWRRTGPGAEPPQPQPSQSDREAEIRRQLARCRKEPTLGDLTDLEHRLEQLPADNAVRKELADCIYSVFGEWLRPQPPAGPAIYLAASDLTQALRPIDSARSDVAKSDPVQPAPEKLDPFRSGTPGRPTGMHLIEADGRRRIEAGEVKPTPRGLATYAGTLAEWWDIERVKFKPHGPKVGSKAIANRLRVFWKSKLPAQNVERSGDGLTGNERRKRRY